MPAGYVILVSVSFTSIIHTAFLAYLTYKLFNKSPLTITYNTNDIVPCTAYPTPTAPIKDTNEYVL